jgi:hypothetical protein
MVKLQSVGIDKGSMLSIILLGIVPQLTQDPKFMSKLSVILEEGNSLSIPI